MECWRYRKMICDFVAIWCFIVAWQLGIISLALGRFVSNFSLLDFVHYVVCHLSTFGYLICHVPGLPDCIHTITPSDWRWITGFVLMLLFSFLSLFPRSKAARIAAMVLFFLLHVAGSLCSFGHIVCDIS